MDTVGRAVGIDVGADEGIEVDIEGTAVGALVLPWLYST